MPIANANTILIQSLYAPLKEKYADGAITPGHLLERTAADKYKIHSTAAGTQARIVAKEDDSQGKSIADAYVAADRVFAHHFLPGDEGLLILKDGENVVIGDYVESAGDGQVQKITAPANRLAGSIVAVVREALNLAATGFALSSRRLHVEFI